VKHLVYNKHMANNRYYKTKLCKHYEMEGWCKNNDNCPFAHGKDDLHNHSSIFKTKMCTHWMRNGWCPADIYCYFAHGVKDLSPSSIYKTKMCTYWMKNNWCPHDLYCYFAHGVKDLSSSSIYKTKMCKDYLKGSCRRRDYCNFAHGESEIRRNEKAPTMNSSAVSQPIHTPTNPSITHMMIWSPNHQQWLPVLLPPMKAHRLHT